MHEDTAQGGRALYWDLFWESEESGFKPLANVKL